MKVDFGAKTFIGWTALHIACFYGKSKVVKCIIENSVQMNIDVYAIYLEMAKKMVQYSARMNSIMNSKKWYDVVKARGNSDMRIYETMKKHSIKPVLDRSLGHRQSYISQVL